MLIIYCFNRLLTELWEGNVFGRVCLSFCLYTGGAYVIITHDTLDLIVHVWLAGGGWAGGRACISETFGPWEGGAGVVPTLDPPLWIRTVNVTWINVIQ